MVRAVLCPTGFGGGEDALWEAGGSVTVHHRGRLHALSQPSSHHPTLRHCTQLTPHAGKSGIPPSLLIVGDVYVLGRLYSFLFQCTTRCMNCSRLHCGAWMKHAENVCCSYYMLKHVLSRTYRIAGKVYGELNLAVWQLGLKLPI